VLDRIFSWGIVIVCFAVVAAAAALVVKALLDPPWPTPEQREELEEKYGRWAVETALAVVPRGDMEKLEREAKRLYESRLVRGF
jgi:hypothetical protein